MIRQCLVNLPWPQPWIIEAFLYVLLYPPWVRFERGDLWEAKGQMPERMTSRERGGR